MNKKLSALMLISLLTGCTASEEVYYPVNFEQEVNILQPSEIQFQPDEERLALQDVEKPLIIVPKTETAPYLESLSKKLRKELRSSGAQVKSENNFIYLTIPYKVAFGSNQNKVQNSFEPVLSSVANLLKEYDKTMIQIVGHTDNMGAVLANREFSLQKANSIADFLKLHGVEANRIFTDGAGAENPVANNKKPEGREQNRRIEITLVNFQ